MQRANLFAFRVNQEERQLIYILAQILQRTQSDAVRFVIVNAVRELKAQQSPRTNISNAKIENNGAK